MGNAIPRLSFGSPFDALRARDSPCHSTHLHYKVFGIIRNIATNELEPLLTINSAFGMSLSYVNSNGTGGASTPQKLADTIIPPTSEIAVMLGEACGASDCGYFQPGSVAYREFRDF
jgi:hypothetical protein